VRSRFCLLLVLTAAGGPAGVRVVVTAAPYEGRWRGVTRVVGRGELRDGACTGPFVEIADAPVRVVSGDYCFRARESTSCGRCRMGAEPAPMLSSAATVSVTLGAWEDCDPDVHGFERSCVDRGLEPLIAVPIARALQLGGPLACAIARTDAEGQLEIHCWGTLGGAELSPAPSIQIFPGNAVALRSRFVVGGGFVCGPGVGNAGTCFGVDPASVLPPVVSWDDVVEPVGAASAVCVRQNADPPVLCGGSLASYSPSEAITDLAAGGERACGLSVNGLDCSDGDVPLDRQISSRTLSRLAVSSEAACLLAESFDGDADNVHCRGRAGWNRVVFDEDLLQISGLCVDGSRGCAARGGQVWCWEPCADGLCAARVEGLPEIADVACGSGFTCGMSLSGADVWCWGTAEGGRLGGALGTAPAQICLP